MEISTSTWMMVAFIVGMIVSIWKMYPFLVNKTLEDDDTGEESYEMLVHLMHKVLADNKEVPTHKELFERIKKHPEFDQQRHWRFNLNKLLQLLNKYYAQHPHLQSIEDVHTKVHSKKN